MGCFFWQQPVINIVIIVKNVFESVFYGRLEADK